MIPDSDSPKEKAFYKISICLILLVFVSCKPKTQDTGLNSNHTLPENGVVSSAHPLATQAGIDILKKGGNAFDAAIAVGAVLNVTEPMMSGMGGYGTILIYDAATGEIKFLDSSGKIPLNTNSDMMRPPTENYLQNRKGAKSVSTPGTVNAWYAMSTAYGNMKWEDLFEEAIRLAKDGFQINSNLAGSIYYAWHNFSDYTKKIYGKDEKPFQEGEVLIQEDLAKSFQQVKEHGPEVFYQGYIAEAIDKAMKETDGFLSIDDLKMDKAEWWEPINIHYKGYDVYTASPPSTAFPSLIRLGIMSQTDMAGMDHNSVEYLHCFAEVSKHAFWCRLRYAGDPEIKPPPLDMLLSTDYWKKIAEDIDPENASSFIPPFDANGYESKNTTHFVVADKFGNIVSATQTLGNAFGSRIMPEGTGIWLNNSLAYCTYEPKGNPMDAIPGQRKLSGDCPTIILKDGNPWAALGTPGGHTIGQTVPQMVINLIDFEMDIQDALNAPRISFVEPDVLAIEDRIGQEVIDRLKEMGHQVRSTGGLGNAHGLLIISDDNGIKGFKGAADQRGKGLAIEY